MYIPTSTYRLQVTSAFNFKNLKSIILYLNRLGATTIYAAPFFEAREGSTHGYDVTDPHILNPEIGSMQEFLSIAEELRNKNMGWLQDIVPNHMAYDHANDLLMDVFEKGRKSYYSTYFDINWEHPDPNLLGKIMTPFIGKPLDQVIKNEELKLDLFNNSFCIRYYESRYPVSIPSYSFIFGQLQKIPVWSSGPIVTSLQNIISNFETIEEIEDFELYDEYVERIKKEFFETLENDPDIKSLISLAISSINKNKKLFQELLSMQNFVLSYWKETEKEINYRRFFTVNDLICLNMQDEEVFNHYHQFILFLYQKGLIQGLRIDHIDGLFDPTQYILQLRQLFGEDTYIVVEKILEWHESLPKEWPIQGTSGYHFLACVSHLYTDHNSAQHFTEIYKNFIKAEISYDDLVRDKKHFMLMNRMKGELDNLIMLMENLDLLSKTDVKVSPGKVREALAFFLVFYPVYRIYGNKLPLSKSDLEVIQNALQKVQDHAPHLENEVIFLKMLLNGEADKAEDYNRNKLYFLMRCQQFAGPLAAKGVEDTAFYIYNRLISHNEVGDSPDIFGVTLDEFHQKMIERYEQNPLAINTTATHDTKRGEDARIRINALSEIPEEWETVVTTWKKINKKHLIKSKDEGEPIPTPNDEYFIYQTLVGAYPMNGLQEDDLEERLKQYMLKVVREAKVNTSWSDPIEEYENGIFAFVESILGDEEFVDSFIPFFRKIADYGALYSISQALIKITAPGIPDIYQGCELWDLSMVDPDNRRPVDYEKREKFLSEMEEKGDDPAYLNSIQENPLDGKIKMYTLYKALNTRKNYHNLFTNGTYIPLKVTGEKAQHIIAFARNVGEEWAIIINPGLMVKSGYQDFENDKESFWGDTAVVLPEEAPETWHESFSGAELTLSVKKIDLKPILSKFPIALLTSKGKDNR